MLTNQMIGDYEILELVGKGGQGEVYKALDTKLKRPVAVKIFTAEGEHRRQKLASFKNEARLASSLNHPNIGTIYGFVEEENHTFIVMEYVEGKNLFELAFGRPLEIKSALEIILQVTDALNAAHARGYRSPRYQAAQRDGDERRASSRAGFRFSQTAGKRRRKFCD